MVHLGVVEYQMGGHGLVVKMRKLLLLLFIGMFLISLASAQIQTLGTFKQNSDIDLTQICDNCTFVNLTHVTRTGENSTIFTFNDLMTKDGTFYNYTFLNTSEIGEYFYSTCGDLNGILTCNSVNFEVNQNGKVVNIPQAIIFIITFFGVLLILSISFFYALRIPWKHHRNSDNRIISINRLRYLKLILIPVTYTLMIWFLNLLLGISEFLSLTIYYGFFNMVFLFFINFSYVFLMAYFIIASIIIFKDSGISSQLKKGIKPR